MDARELRIGNLINYRIQDNLDEKKDWFEVSEIDATDLAVLENNIDYDYHPIPLTEEWLIRFGFQKNDEGRYDKRMELDFDGKYYHFKQGWTNVELKYIHQLQNLFYAITGKELELKWQ